MSKDQWSYLQINVTENFQKEKDVVYNVNSFEYDKSQRLADVAVIMTKYEYVLQLIPEKKPKLLHVMIHRLERKRLFDATKDTAPDIKAVPDISNL